MLVCNMQNKRFIAILSGLIFANILFVLWTLFHSSIIVCDDIEHLSAAYFVSLGEVPYRDFFEHHHPLLWYVLWPLIKILPHSTVIGIYVGRLLSLFVSLGTGYYFYQIVRRFIGGKTVALLSVVLFFAGMPAWYSLINIKPDIYMRLFYFMGLYYLFLYFRYQRRGDLCICGVAWTIGFLFLQTIIFYILPLILPVGWKIYQTPRKIKDFLAAAVLPLIIMIIFVGLLYSCDAWKLYFELNWVFNSKLSMFLSQISSRQPFLLFADTILLAIGAVIYLCRYNKINIYMATIMLLFIMELIQRAFGLAAYTHYFVMLFAFGSMLSAPFVYKIGCKMQVVTYGALLLFAVLHIVLNVLHLYKYKFHEQPFYYLEKYELSSQQVYGYECSIYQLRRGYFWSLPEIETLYDIYFDRGDNYDVNEIIKNEEIRYYCLSKSGKHFYIQNGIKLNLSPKQQKIIKRHYLSDDFYKNYREIKKDLYEKKVH